MASSEYSFRVLALDHPLPIIIGQQFLNSTSIWHLRSVNKAYKTFIDEKILSFYWSKLEKNTPLGILDIPKQMNIVIQNNPGAAYSLLFQKLTSRFTPVVASGTPPIITTTDFTNLQDDAQRLQDEALLAIWPKLLDALQKPSSVPTADVIRKWLNDPNNAALLNGVTGLDLSNLQLKVFPPEITMFSQLDTLDLSFNHLSCLPDEICGLTKLKILNLNRNNFTTLPRTVGALTGLRTLYLSENKLRALPDTIKALVGLKMLILSNNQFSTLPEAVNALIGLQTLNFSFNQLRTLPNTIKALVGLQMLNFSNNLLSTLPATLGALTGLLDLRLQRNLLSTLPDTIGSLTELQQLNLSNNKLTALPHTIGSLTELQMLYLSNNQIAALRDEVIALTKLRKIELNGNPLIFSLNCPSMEDNETICKLHRELKYPSASPLAKLYQRIIRKNKSYSKSRLKKLYQLAANKMTDHKIKKKFYALAMEDQQLILRTVSIFLGTNIDVDPQWSESCIFANTGIFYLAVKKAIFTKFEHLSEDERDRVYCIVLTEKRPSSDLNHVLDNLPLLADAMALLDEPKSNSSSKEEEEDSFVLVNGRKIPS